MYKFIFFSVIVIYFHCKMKHDANDVCVDMTFIDALRLR